MLNNFFSIFEENIVTKKFFLKKMFLFITVIMNYCISPSFAEFKERGNFSHERSSAAGRLFLLENAKNENREFRTF